MSVYPIFNKDGDNSIINRLKKTWPSYYKNASEVKAKFGNDMRDNKDKAGINMALQDVTSSRLRAQ